MNTVDDKFLDYCGRRSTKINGAFMSVAEAYFALGIFGGDDSLPIDIDAEAHKRAAAAWGQQLEISVVERGQFGVNFLSRYYSPEVWYGSTNSCCDIMRQLPKFHLTVSLNDVTPVEKLIEKARSFYLTDAETPVIGELVTAVIKLFGKCPEYGWAGAKTYQMERFGSHCPIDVQYPNVREDWMFEFFFTQNPAADIKTFKEYLDSCRTMTDFLCVPIINEPSVPTAHTNVAMVVNGTDMIVPNPKKPQENLSLRPNDSLDPKPNAHLLTNTDKVVDMSKSENFVRGAGGKLVKIDNHSMVTKIN